MQLKTYLKKNKITVSSFAMDLGLTYHVIYYVIRGGTPQLHVAKKIIDKTSGQVSISDLLQDRVRPW